MVHQFIYQHGEVSSSNKSISLFYSAKSVEEMCYLDEFIRLADEFSNVQFYPFLSKAENAHVKGSNKPHSKVVQPWQGATGRLSAEKLTLKLELYLSRLQSQGISA